eukprot:m51a1_g10967 hypothetical protein (605) ;mRNA; f:250484-253352
MDPANGDEDPSIRTAWDLLQFVLSEVRDPPSLHSLGVACPLLRSACQRAHPIFSRSGRLLLRGSNEEGQLGAHKIADAHNEIVLPGTVCAVDSGARHVAAVLDDGSLYVWGNNQHFEMGDGDGPARQATPKLLKMAAPVAQVACGYYHVVSLLSNGEVWAWGDHSDGQLGFRTDKSIRRFATTRLDYFPTDSPVVSLTAGGGHCAAKLGQLGLGDRKNRPVPAPFAIKCLDPEKESVMQLSCGAGHTAAITDKGRLFCWGYNSDGQIGNSRSGEEAGIPTPVEIAVGPVLSCSLGGRHTLALLRNGEVWAWGRGREGQLGFGRNNRENTLTPKVVEFLSGLGTVAKVFACHGSFIGNTSAALLVNGDLYMWGSSTNTMLDRVEAVLFDLDGTLVDTETISTKVINDILAPFNKTCNKDLKKRLLGQRAEEWTHLVVTELNIADQLTPKQLQERWAEGMIAEVAGAALMPGADALTRHLHDKGIPLAICTSSGAKATGAKAKSHPDIFSRMSAVLTAEDVGAGRGKPLPDVYLAAAKRLGVNPEKCIVFEDAPAGAVAGKAAGCFVVAVPGEDLDGRPFQGIAHAVVHSLEAVKPEQYGLPPFSA